MTRIVPTLPPSVRRLFRLPGSRARMLRDLDEELQTHLAMRVDELRGLGLSEAEAQAEALRRFGDTAEFREHAARRVARRARRLRVADWLETWPQDMRYAWRQVVKAPAFTAIAVLTLALGIGANTAIFSVVHRLFLAPLPYPNGNRIVLPIDEDSWGGLPTKVSVSPELALLWQARTRTAETISGTSEEMFSVRPDGTVDTIPTARITASFLPMLGVRPVLGRNFTVDEERADTPTVAMISHALWQRSYGGRADALGRVVHYEGRPLSIVGVTPRALAIPRSRNAAPDVWLPTRIEHAGRSSGGIPGPYIFATLRAGVAATAATAELRTISATLPDSLRPASVRAMRPQDFLDTREMRAVQVLFAAVGALLLIACANVANLLLARAWTRQREFAVRAALGAGRRRLARQVLTESLSLALAGGLLGIAIAWAAVRVIVALRPPALEHLADVRIEPIVLLWSFGVSVATGILFGCAPAIVAGARQVGDVLRRETRGGSAGVTSRRIRSTLIVLEIAMSLVLLIGSGLLIRSFRALQQMPLGYEPRGLVYADVIVGGPRDREGRVAMRDAIIARLRALPGVTGVSIGTLPVNGWIGAGGLEVETSPNGQTKRVPELGTVFITPDYFQVTRVALVAGRLPDPSTLTEAWKAGRFGLSPEVLVNRGFARRAWPGTNALGSRIRMPVGVPPGTRPPEAWSTVVGIVDDTRMPDVRGEVAMLQVYSLIPPRLGNVPFMVRSATSGDVAAPMVKHAIVSVDPTIYVRRVLSGDRYLRDGLAPTRFAMALLTGFAVVAIMLAAVGLYGVIAYGVSQRTREIGVRVALGAAPNAVALLIVRGGLRLAAVGLALGAAAAAASTRVLRSMLYEVSPGDPRTFAAIALLVAAITLLASYVPARRASRIDPTEALRVE